MIVNGEGVGEGDGCRLVREMKLKIVQMLQVLEKKRGNVCSWCVKPEITKEPSKIIDAPLVALLWHITHGETKFDYRPARDISRLNSSKPNNFILCQILISMML